MMINLTPCPVRIEDYNYVLPDEMIARFPCEDRAGSKILVYDKGDIGHTYFHNIPRITDNGGLMIFNNTKVIQARILMYKETGSRIEILILEPVSPAEYNLAFSSVAGCRWKCMVGNKKRWKNGKLVKELIIKGERVTLETFIVNDHGPWQEIEFMWTPAHYPFSLIIDKAGLTPIPPYLDRMPVDSDKWRYQTVYSSPEGSVAAPTAGLHFTGEILETLKKNGASMGEITLHVGAGTFQPVTSAMAGEHLMHAENFSVNRKTIKKLRNNPGRITAVGTTSVRALESIYWLGVKQLISKKGFLQNHELLQWEETKLPSYIPADRSLEALEIIMENDNIAKLEAKTQLMITPGYRFRIANKMITNFHQPKSTLLLLVAAFIGNDWRKVYNYALDNDFRFLSYGDSSLLIPKNEAE